MPQIYTDQFAVSPVPWPHRLHRWFKRQRNRIGARLAREQIDSWHKRHAAWKEAYSGAMKQRDKALHERDSARHELHSSKKWQEFVARTIEASSSLRREIADKIAKDAPWLADSDYDYKRYFAADQAARVAAAIIHDMLSGKTVTFDLIDDPVTEQQTAYMRVDTVTLHAQSYHRAIPLDVRKVTAKA